MKNEPLERIKSALANPHHKHWSQAGQEEIYAHISRLQRERDELAHARIQLGLIKRERDAFRRQRDAEIERVKSLDAEWEHLLRDLEISREARRVVEGERDEAMSSLRELLQMIAQVPEEDLVSLGIDPYGTIGDALEALGESREPDSWRALHRFCGFPDPGEAKA